MKQTPDEWSRHVRSWRQSGESAREYCERRGLKVGSLRYWSSRIRRDLNEKLTAAAAAPAPTVKMARVVRELPPRRPGISIAMGAFRVDVGPEFDEGVLGRVLDVLASRAAGAKR